MSDEVIPDVTTLSMCLENVRRLVAEISAAIDAISRNALPELELSLWNQEMSCAGLRRLLQDPLVVRDEEAVLLLRAEFKTLLRLTGSYERVVQRAGDSTSLLIDLCSLHAAEQGLQKPSIFWEA